MRDGDENGTAAATAAAVIATVAAAATCRARQTAGNSLVEWASGDTRKEATRARARNAAVRATYAAPAAKIKGRLSVRPIARASRANNKNDYDQGDEE